MHFPDGYLSSRTAILSATETRASNVESIECPVRGPNSASLFMDAVYLEGSAPGNSMLILTSGLHGVEGPVGAAVQLAAIDQWKALEQRPCLLVLHALNPHGFAWSRRQDASGIDLNRNFLSDQESYQGVDPVYTDLDPLLNPKRPPGYDGFLLRSALTTARIGLPKLKQVLAEGQFEFPKGLFFGGKEPSWTMQIFQQHLLEWVGQTERVLMLDVHSGLGPWGKLQLMETRQSSPDQRRRLLTHFAEFSDAFDLERPLHYQTRGDFGSWCADQLKNVDFQYFCAEFGTYGPLRTLSALRSELQEWEWGGSQPDIDSSVRRRVREVFCPKSSQWRMMVAAQTKSMLSCAFDYLRDSDEPSAR